MESHSGRICGHRPWRLPSLRRWDNLAKVLFAQARERGEVFHLWGHSREIEEHNDWQRLEDFLAWLHEQNVVSACNSDVALSAPRALITTPYFKPSSGGVQEYCYQIAKGLKEEKDWNISIVTSGAESKVCAESYEGLIIHRLPIRVKFSNTPLGFRWRKQIKSIISVERPDVVIAHGPVPGMLDVTAGLVKKTPLIVTYHTGTMLKGNIWPDVVIRCYERLVLPRALRNAQQIICCSNFVRTSPLMSRYVNKCTVIHPAVDASVLVPRANDASRPRRLIHVGGLNSGEDYKGLKTSLQVLAKLMARYSDLRLIVVGDGDKRPYYETLAERLGIAQQVDFRGRLLGQDLIDAYQSADILITPSHKESFGMAILEAMSCGLPAVASKSEGIPDLVIHGESGFLVEYNDVSGFVGRISDLLDNAAMLQRFGQKARGFAARPEYSWARQVELTGILLEAVVRDSHRDRQPTSFRGTPYAALTTSRARRRPVIGVRGTWRTERASAGNKFALTGVNSANASN